MYFSLFKNLRCHVRRRPNALCERHVRHEEVDVPRAPKVRQLPEHVNHTVKGEDKDVVPLDVGVEELIHVEVLQSPHRVEHQLGFDPVIRLSSFLDAVHKRAARRLLHHHHDVVLNEARAIEVVDPLTPELVQHRDLLRKLVQCIVASIRPPSSS